MSINGTKILALNSAGNALAPLKVNSAGLLRVVAEATSVSANQIDLNTDGLEGLIGSTNTALATIDGVLDNAEAHLGNIDTGVDVLEACVGSNKVNVNISSGNITGFATATNQATIIGHVDGVESSLTAITGYVDGIEGKQDTMIGHMDGVEGLLGTIDADTDAIKTSTAAMVVDLAAIEVVMDNAEAHLGNIDIGVDVLEACVGSNKVNVNISSGNITGFSTSSNQSTIIGHLDGVEGLIGSTNSKIDTFDAVLDASLVKHTNNETLLTAQNALITTIDGVLDNAEAHLGNIDTGIDVLEACVGSNKVNVNISSGNISGFSTASNQSTIIGHLDGVEGKLDTLETTLTAIETDQAAIEVLHTATNQKLGDIETAVQLIDDAIKTEDLAHSSGDKGIPCLMVRQDSHSDLAADGDYMIPTINANGEIRVTSTAASGGSTEAKQDTVIGHIDGIETLIGSTNSKIDTFDAVLDASLVKHTNNETLLTAQNALITTIDGVLDNILVKNGEIETTNNANQVLLGTIDSDTNNIKTAVEILSANQSKTATQLLYGTGNLVANGSPESSSNSVELKNNGERVTTFIEAQNASWDAFNEWSYDNSTWFTDTSLNFSGAQNIQYHDFKKGKYLRVKVRNNQGSSGDTNAFVVNIVQ